MSHQHGKALYNNYKPEFRQSRRPEFQLKSQSEFTKSNLTKNNDYSSKTDSINPAYQSNIRLDSLTFQLNPVELKLKQDNQAFKNYMINLCRSYIDNIGLREYDLTELEDLYNVLTETNINKPNLQGGDEPQRNYTYQCVKTTPVEINLSWTVDNNNCIVLEYTNKTGKDIRNYRYLIGDNDTNNIIPEIMEYLNTVLLTLHTRELNYYNVYMTCHFNHQVISLLNYYINKDLDYFRQTKIILVLSTIYYHINAFKNLTNQNNKVFNVITNALAFTCSEGAFLGDCALNSYLASTNSKLRENIVEYFIKDYYNDNIGGQQMDNLITEIRDELDRLFNAVSSIEFSGFVNSFKSNLFSMLVGFRFNLHIACKYKVSELSKLYASILLVKAKINYITTMIIRAPNLNFNVLTEAFEHAYTNRNCVNRLIAEKYDDSNKHYLTLPVTLYKIPHAVLLVIERNDNDGSNVNDRGYVVDLNDMSILFNQPANKFVTSSSDSRTYILPNPSENIIKYKAQSSITDPDSGITVDKINITDKCNSTGIVTISKWYETYLKRCSSYLDFDILTNEYNVNIQRLFTCTIDDTFNVTQQIYNDLFNMIPNILQSNGLNKNYLTNWGVNTISMFTMCINKVIEYLSQFYDNIPWEHIITGVNQLNYHYLFYVIDYLQLISQLKTYNNYPDYFVYQSSRYNSNLYALKSAIIKLNTIDETILNTSTDIVNEIKDDIKDKACLTTTIFELLNNELDKLCDELLKSIRIHSNEINQIGTTNLNQIYRLDYNRILSIVEHRIKFISSMTKINSSQTNWLNQLVNPIVIKANCQTTDSNVTNPSLSTIDAYDILKYVYQLNNSVGLSFKPMYLELKDSVKSYKLHNKYKGGNDNTTSLMTIVQQLLMFLLVLVIVIIIVVLIIKGVQLMFDDE